MPATMKTLGIDRLTVEERLSLVEEIWDSITSEAPYTLPEHQQQDLQRRMANHAVHPNAGSPWEEVQARLEAQL